MSKALEALLDYVRLDHDGVVVEVSRQAIHEVAAEIERLEARNARLLAALKEGHDCLLDVGSGGGGWAWEEVAAAMHEAITTEEKKQLK